MSSFDDKTTQRGNTTYGDNVGGDKVVGDKVGRDKITNIYPPNPTPTLTPQQRRNREIMLNKVESFWIEGVLDQSLYRIARIELGLEQAPERVEHPWDSLIQRANQTPAPLPPGKPTIELFNEFHGALLILGAPGGGKTTLLLELARDLIVRARLDEQLPIPVVFNLSSWATRHRPLGEWLLQELNQRYFVSEKVAKEWIDTNALLLLLDGLDEVATYWREGCVKAINTFRKQRGFIPLVVCSRVEEYADLSNKLQMESAIVIQPLTPQKIEKYLKDVGRRLAAVRTALRDDPSLWELLDSPLILGITALAYKDKSVTKLLLSETLEERRRQLFDDYIEAMFVRPGRSRRSRSYTQEQTTHYLSWLADNLMKQNQTMFSIEWMQPSWLPEKQQRWFLIEVGVLTALLVGLLFGLLFGLVGGPFVGLIFGLVVSLLVGLNLTESDRIETTDIVRWSWPTLEFVFGEGLIFSLIFGLIVGLIVGLLKGLIFGIATGLSGVLAVGLMRGLIYGLSWNQLSQYLTPNQGIQRSAANGIRIGLLFGLVTGLVFGSLFTLIGELLGLPLVNLLGRLVFGLVFGLIFGLFGGLLGGLVFGCRTVIHHYFLRFLLYRNGSLPFKYLIPFLDYSVERIFLRRIGGGYIFVHRLLMEHFASFRGTFLKICHNPTCGWKNRSIAIFCSKCGRPL